jgi:hypothetical protein
MAKSIRIGVDLERGQPLMLDPKFLQTHMHLVGATGAGKTTAIHALLRPLMKNHRQKCAMFVIDPMGGLSADLLQWMASRKCPEHVRERLVYIEPAREESVVPINPLTFVSEAHRYYQVARAVDLILRAWAAQDLGQQPRLMQWSYRAMCSMAAMGYPISMSRFLLHPGSEEHKALLRKLPADIQHHWQEILNARGSEATRILESTRNRFDPFYESVVLRRMFGSTESRFDAERMIRDRRIVIVNVAPMGRIPMQLGGTIGSLIVNEILETARNMTTQYGKKSVEPTYLLLDEFQRFAASPDIEDALPTVRQLGLRLILAHQSFSQLVQGDIDLTNMIWQARSRLMFANSAEDADIIANELAVLTFNRFAIKNQINNTKQLVTGYRTEWLNSEGVTNTHAEGSSEQNAFGYSAGVGNTTNDIGQFESRKSTTGDSRNHGSGSNTSDSRSSNRGRSQSLVPIHEMREEVSSITYESFDEHRLEWMKIIRQLKTGEAFGRFVDDNRLYHLGIHYEPIRETPSQQRRLQELLQRNFEQDIFISASTADQLAERDRQRLLGPDRIVLRDESKNQESADDDADSHFR